MAQRIQRIGVVGFGLMGSGIAQLCATAGFPVRVREITPELARRGLDSVARQLARAVEKEKLTAAERDLIDRTEI